MPGCRSSTSRGPAALRSGILSMDGGADWRKAPRLYSRMPRFSAASYTSSAIPSATSQCKQECIHEAQMKLIYGAINVKQARQESEKFKTDWQAYPGAVSVWETISHTSSTITMAVPCATSCTRPTIESVNSSLQGDQERRFPNEDAVFKIFYLRIQELYKMEGSSRRKLGDGPNQSLMDDRMSQLMQRIRCCLLNDFT